MPAFALLFAIAGCSDLGNPLHHAPRCRVSATLLDFGAVAVNDSASRTVILHNDGDANLGGVAAACSGFRIASGAGGFELRPGDSLAIVVHFLPTQAGAANCTLDLGTGCPVTLQGLGLSPQTQAACEVAPSALAFGDVDVGTSSDRSLVIRSVGTADLVVDVVSTCTDFLVVQGGGAQTIPPGDSLVVTVRFNPMNAGSSSCAITSAPECSDVTVSGNGVASSSISFAHDIQPIFNFYCTSCHGFNGGLSLDAGVSYGHIVNVQSQGYFPAVRVKPFDPDASVLYQKIINSGLFGGGMPQGGSITQAEKDKIFQWIVEGAQDN